jgi:hypothetical protein
MLHQSVTSEFPPGRADRLDHPPDPVESEGPAVPGSTNEAKSNTEVSHPHTSTAGHRQAPSRAAGSPDKIKRRFGIVAFENDAVAKAWGVGIAQDATEFVRHRRRRRA